VRFGFGRLSDPGHRRKTRVLRLGVGPKYACKNGAQRGSYLLLGSPTSWPSHLPTATAIFWHWPASTPR
jgi:hypothetical protein